MYTLPRSSFFSRLGVIVLLLAASACADGEPTSPEGTAETSAGARQDELLVPASGARLTQPQQEKLARIAKRPTTAQVHVAQLANAPGALLKADRVIVLNVGPGVRFVAVGNRVTERGPADVSFGGPLKGTQGTLDAVLTPNGLTAAIHTRDESYSVQPLGGGLHAVVRIDRGKLPPDHAPDAPAESMSRPSFATASAPLHPLATAPTGGPLAQNSSSTPRLDVLVVYTADAALASGDMAGQIQMAIDQTNASYTNSQVSATVNLVGASEVPYVETGRTYPQHLTALENATNGLQGVPAMRNNTIADMVVLVVEDAASCGRASRVLATAATAFAVVTGSCMPDSYSFAHELGHLQGADHDLPNNCTVQGYPCGPYTYGYGYVSPTGAWRTIMAGDATCGGCLRVNYWSNPLITYNGEAMGTDQHRNAYVLSNTSRTVRDFRTLSPPSNLSHSNVGSQYANPMLTWSAVAGANRYLVERCVVANGAPYSNSCFYAVINPYPTNTYYSDFQYQHTGSNTASYNCPKIARYRVRTDSWHGLSLANEAIGVCVY